VGISIMSFPTDSTPRMRSGAGAPPGLRPHSAPPNVVVGLVVLY